jgi:hypothetical protein
MFTIEYVKNLKWANLEKTAFSCVVKYAEFSEELPVGADPRDHYEHIQQIWQNGLAGMYGPIEDYDPWEGAEQNRPENINLPVTVF